MAAITGRENPQSNAMHCTFFFVDLMAAVELGGDAIFAVLGDFRG